MAGHRSKTEKLSSSYDRKGLEAAASGRSHGAFILLLLLLLPFAFSGCVRLLVKFRLPVAFCWLIGG